MSLEKCAECKKEISDQAVDCPHCGVPLKSMTVQIENKPGKNLKVEIELTNKRWKKVILISWIMLILGILIFGSISRDIRYIGAWIAILSVPTWIIGKVGAWYSNR